MGSAVRGVPGVLAHARLPGIRYDALLLRLSMAERRQRIDGRGGKIEGQRDRRARATELKRLHQRIDFRPSGGLNLGESDEAADEVAKAVCRLFIPGFRANGRPDAAVNHRGG